MEVTVGATAILVDANTSPQATPTITATRPPLSSSTRVAIIPSGDNPTTVVMASTSVPETVAGNINPAVVVSAAVPQELPLPLMFGVGFMTLSGAAYGGLYLQGQRKVRRYQRGFVVDRCPVCLQGKLQVETTSRHRLGLPYVSKRTVKCPSCRSILRETSPGHWKYRINPIENPKLHQKWHDRVIDESQLRKLGKTRQS
jgi:hypothetical protein